MGQFREKQKVTMETETMDMKEKEADVEKGRNE